MEGIRRRSLVRRAADDAVKSFYQHPLLLFPVVAVLFALGCAVAVVCVSVGVWTILQWIYGAWPSVALPQPVLDSFDSVSALLARVGVPQLLVNFWSVLRTCCQTCLDTVLFSYNSWVVESVSAEVRGMVWSSVCWTSKSLLTITMVALMGFITWRKARDMHAAWTATGVMPTADVLWCVVEWMRLAGGGAVLLSYLCDWHLIDVLGTVARGWWWKMLQALASLAFVVIVAYTFLRARAREEARRILQQEFEERTEQEKQWSVRKTAEVERYCGRDPASMIMEYQAPKLERLEEPR